MSETPSTPHDPYCICHLCDPDGDYAPDDGDSDFDCPRFWIKGEGWFCPAQGSEDCDWECPHGR